MRTRVLAASLLCTGLLLLGAHAYRGGLLIEKAGVLVAIGVDKVNWSALFAVAPNANDATKIDVSLDAIVSLLGQTIGTLEVINDDLTGDDIASSYAGDGLEEVVGSPDVLRVKLNGSTLARSASGMSVNAIGTAQCTDGSLTGDDMNANIAGRSLVKDTGASPDEIDADPELYTDAKCAWIEDPAVEDLDGLYYFMSASTVTRVWCETNAGTVDVNIERDDGSPANVLSAELVCDVGEQTSCASGCDVNTIQGAEDNFAQYSEFNISISAVATATRVSVCVGFTRDD